jgi:hypothetical protein
MTDMIVLLTGIAIGVIYEKQIKRLKDRAERAAKAASQEFKN